MTLKALGSDGLNRAVHALSVSCEQEVPCEGLLESKHFACLVLWDSSEATVQDGDRLLASLLLQGASYLMFWGPGYRRMHDVADETIVALRDRLGLAEDATVMTTDHHAESLEDAVWFFQNVSSPHASLSETTKAAIVITIGSAVWAADVERMLLDPARAGAGSC